ncbi:MFS transporter [Arachidicoccus terrestris]|uniref:MFS transporter n=1 Tax=Arachidicoccus terrestris TaxID=2875539 RepID=UPI001CC33B1F|nr:MFS transporter [Arachidicoccus terrestris]
MKIKSGEFIALSASSMMLTALGIDIMLPVFGAVGNYFELPPDSNVTANIVVFFFMGQIAQLIFGILSDHFGRLTILRIGFPLYIISGVIAAFAPSLPVMFVARFVAGMGASAVFSTTVAGVRDRFVGDQMARIMSLIFTVFLFTPVFAPFLGKIILAISTWHMVFLAPSLFAAFVFLWSFRLEESLPKQSRRPVNWNNIQSSFVKIVMNRQFIRYAGTSTILFAAFSAYIASSEYIIAEKFGHPELFTWIFAGIGLLMAFTTSLNARLVNRFGARRTLRGLIVIYTTIGGLLLLYTILSGHTPRMWVFFLAVAPMLALNLAIEPNSSALGLEPLGDTAGFASAIYGTFFFFIGASLGSVVSHYLVNGVLPLILCFFGGGVIAFLLIYSDRRVHVN